jgi:hypothetical protein
MNNNAPPENKIFIYFKKYSIALIICFIFFISLIHGYAAKLDKYDMQLTNAEEFYNKLLPYSFIKIVISSPDDKLRRGCDDIISLLKKNGIYESNYYASIFTKEAVNLINSNPARARLLFGCAKKFSPSYQKAYFSQAAASFYDFDPLDSFYNIAHILYFNFLAPGAIFNSMNLALIGLISFILIQFVFLAALYLKYRRLIMHEAHELEINAVNISIAPYLDSKEKTASSLLSKNIIICLMFVIFYCYFSTGFGKYLKLCGEINYFLKNHAEFQAVNAMPADCARLADLDKILVKAFVNEKISLDFYNYFSYTAKLLSNDPKAALYYLKRINHNSFLINKTDGGDPVFLDDSDLYRAFFSPMRSNPIFMIAVLLNVLLIIVFMGIIRKAAIFRNAAKADLCACSTISCPECRVQVGLCNCCLMPLKAQDINRNINNVFYPHDKNIIYYISLILPGFSFFYFSEFVLAFFYSAAIINLIIYNLTAYAGLFEPGAALAALAVFVYIIYIVEYWFYIKSNYK